MDTILHQAFKPGKQRDVRLRQRFDQPMLFEEMRILGVADEGQMRVEDEEQMSADGHRLTSVADDNDVDDKEVDDSRVLLSASAKWALA